MREQIKKVFATWLLVAVAVVGISASSYAQQGKEAPAQETVRSVVAKQAALVSEFDVNGLKVLLKRREGSLTVAAGLFIRGGSTNINAQNAGIEAWRLRPPRTFRARRCAANWRAWEQ
jgi:zinc protease